MTYDEQGNRLSWLSEDRRHRDPTEPFLPKRRALDIYDGAGKRVETIHQLYAPDGWMDTRRVLYTYDDQGRLRAELKETYGLWQSRTLFAHDEQGNVIQETEQTYDRAQEVWVDGSRQLYEYNAANERIEEVFQHWAAPLGQWVNFQRRQYQHGLILKQKWMGQWVDDWRTVIQYDAQGMVTEELHQKRGLNVWLPHIRFVWEKDAAHDLQWHVRAEQWMDDTASWRLIFASEALFNEAGHLVKEHRRAWDAETASLVNQLQWEFSYKSLDELYPSTTGTATELPQVLHVSPAYPNPLTAQTVLEIRAVQDQNVQVQVYDIQGRLVQTLHDGWLAGGTVTRLIFKAHHVPAGLYMIHIKGDQIRTTQKVTVLR